MAQTILCDYTGCGELADVIVSNLENGETVAWCGPHYIEAAIAIADSVANGEADQAAAAAESALEGVVAVSVEDGIELDEEALLARLDPQPAHIIHRGQSRKAKAHQARLDADKAAREDATAAIGPARNHPDGDPAHDDTWHHHHDDQTGDAVWWEGVEQFGGDKTEHQHAPAPAP